MLKQKSINHRLSKRSTPYNHHALLSESTHGNRKDNKQKYHQTMKKDHLIISELLLQLFTHTLFLINIKLSPDPSTVS